MGSRRSIAVLAAMLATAIATRSARADEAPAHLGDVFVLDPTFGMEGGVRSTAALRRLVFGYERVLPTFVKLDEGKKVDRAIALLGRLAQFLFLDEPIAELETLVVHEVFGHGFRARDFGYSSAPKFALPGIYCALLTGSAADPCTSFAGGISSSSSAVDQNLAINFGGIESNHVSAWWQNARLAMGDGRFHHSDMLVYAISKGNYANALVSPPDSSGGALSNDVYSYVSGLQQRFNRPSNRDRVSLNKRLQTAYIWNFVDPLLWFSLYSIMFDSVLQGKRDGQIPLPHIGKTSFLPSPRFNLSPFGAEHYLDVFLNNRGRTLNLYGRIGTSGLARYGGAGIRLLALPVGDRISAGAELDLWNQPETNFDAHEYYRRRNQSGFNLGATVEARVVDHLGVIGRLAYKSSGYLMGQPMTEGFHGYIGVSLTP